MRAFTRNASSRDELKDEEDPASPTTPLDYSGTTTGLKGRPTEGEYDRLADEQMQKLEEFVAESVIRHRRGGSVNTQARAPGLPAFLRLTRSARRHLHLPLRLAWRYLDSRLTPHNHPTIALIESSKRETPITQPQQSSPCPPPSS